MRHLSPSSCMTSFVTTSSRCSTCFALRETRLLASLAQRVLDLRMHGTSKCMALTHDPRSVTYIPQVLDVFRMWDVDEDGTVSQKEFADAITALGCGVTREHTDKLFETFDQVTKPEAHRYPCLNERITASW